MSFSASQNTPPPAQASPPFRLAYHAPTHARAVAEITATLATGTVPLHTACAAAHTAPADYLHWVDTCSAVAQMHTDALAEGHRARRDALLAAAHRGLLHLCQPCTLHHKVTEEVLDEHGVATPVKVRRTAKDVPPAPAAVLFVLSGRLHAATETEGALPDLSQLTLVELQALVGALPPPDTLTETADGDQPTATTTATPQAPQPHRDSFGDRNGGAL